MNTTTDKMPCMALEAVKQETGVKQDKRIGRNIHS